MVKMGIYFIFYEFLVSSTTFPIEDLDWPTVTICGQGRGLGAIEKVYKSQIKRFVLILT